MSPARATAKVLMGIPECARRMHFSYECVGIEITKRMQTSVKYQFGQVYQTV